MSLSQSFQDTLYLFACGVHGKNPQTKKIDNFEDVLLCAYRQGVAQLIYPPANYLFQQGCLDIEEKKFIQYKNYVMSSVIVDTKRQPVIHKLIKSFEALSIDYCLLKGIILAPLYHDSQLRISSDTDIFVGTKDFERAISVLKENGFTVEPMFATSHHALAHHKTGGTVELHYLLYDELIQDTWFDNKALILEPFRRFDTDGDMFVQTLGITDGLIFIALHFIKHFLEAGVGIRQLMDMLLYMKNYSSEIDWDRFNSLMKQLKYNKFIAHAIGIGVKYLGFNDNELPKSEYNPDTMLKILDDFEKGGIFGQNENERKGFYLYYTKAVINAKNAESYTHYIKRWWKPNIIPILFPHPQNLKKKFRYLNISPILYPIAWLHRVIIVLTNVFLGKRKLGVIINPSSSFPDNATIQKRMMLIKELEMI